MARVLRMLRFRPEIIHLPAELLYSVQQSGGFFGQIGFLLYRVQQFGANRSEIGVLSSNCCTKYNNSRLLRRKGRCIVAQNTTWTIVNSGNFNWRVPNMWLMPTARCNQKAVSQVWSKRSTCTII